MRSPILTLLIAAPMAAALPASPAAAAGWTPTQSFAVGKQHEPAPRAAIAADGSSVLAWESKSGKLMLSTGRADGRFTAPRRIDEAGVRDWSVAARDGGGFIVAWQDTDGIHTATRTRAGRPTVRRLAVVSNGEEINGLQVATDPLGGWALAERGRALIAATRVRSRGDAGDFGDPVVAGLSPAGALGVPFGPAVANPRRAFGPSAAFTSGGRSVLVFSLKPSSQPFEKRAPVKAVAISATAVLGKLQTLTSSRAKEPVVMALAGGRALTLWSGERGLGASLAGSDGIFKTTATPKGPPPPPFHFNSTNRDLRTGGRYAIFTWSRDADGRVRVSVRKL